MALLDMLRPFGGERWPGPRTAAPVPARIRLLPARPVAPDAGLDRRLPRLPDFQIGEDALRRFPLRSARYDQGDFEFPAQGPQHGRLRTIGFAQTPDTAQRSTGMAGHDQFGQTESVEASAVCNRPADFLEFETAIWEQQRQTINLLRGGQQIAFQAHGEKIADIVFGLQPFVAESLGDPARKFCRLDAPGRHVYTNLFDCLDPGRSLLRQLPLVADDQQYVVALVVDPLPDRLATLGARLAGGQPQFHQSSACEQRTGLRGLTKFGPVETAVGGQPNPLVDLTRATGFPHLVGRFFDDQSLRSSDEVDRCELARQLLREAFGVKLHVKRPS